MTNRKLAYIVKDQKPLVLTAHETVQHACLCMRERRAGSVLVTDLSAWTTPGLSSFAVGRRPLEVECPNSGEVDSLLGRIPFWR
jgi:hypothetical protein